jgi:basic membrane protein A and related proteins
MRARVRGRVRLVAAVAGVLLVACTGTAPGGAASGSVSERSPSEVRVAVTFESGGLEDAFNAAADRGVDRAVADGLILRANTEVAPGNASGSNAADNLAGLARSGYGLIVAVGGGLSPAVDKLARRFPKQDFAVVDGYARDAPNVTNLIFKANEGSFLVGAAAAMKSRTGTIGFLGGQQGTGTIESFQTGYEAGAKQVDPRIDVVSEYVGDTPAAFNDVAAGERLANKMYREGADVIFQAAGKSGLGLFKAAVAQQALAIGADSDQSLTAKPAERGVILTSMVKRVDTAVYDTIGGVVDRQFVSGYQSFGLADGGVGYAVNEYNDIPRLLSPQIQARLQAYRQRIVSGEITVPTQPQD